jgi:hypothetical protein
MALCGGTGAAPKGVLAPIAEIHMAAARLMALRIRQYVPHTAGLTGSAEPPGIWSASNAS